MVAELRTPIYAAIIPRGGERHLDGKKPLVGYGLEVDGRSRGRVEFYVGESTPGSAQTGVEVVAVDEDCVARLLADAIGQLADENEDGDIDESPFEKPPGMRRSAGIVLVDERGRLTIREPAISAATSTITQRGRSTPRRRRSKRRDAS